MKKLDVIFEDEYIIVINKEAGMLSIPDRYSTDLPNLQSLIQKELSGIYTVHRIDKNTSGAVIFCKSEESHLAFSKLWEEKEITKKYLAISEGNVSFQEKLINQPIREHGTKKGQYTVGKGGRPSQTKIRIIEKFKTYSVVEANLLTGRTHQIRVHLKHIGLPIIADDTYGSSDQFFLSSIKKRKFNLKKYEEEQPIMRRQALHAHSLHFIHPFTSKEKTIEAPLPKDMRATLNQLRKWNRLD